MWAAYSFYRAGLNPDCWVGHWGNNGDTETAAALFSLLSRHEEIGMNRMDSGKGMFWAGSQDPRNSQVGAAGRVHTMLWGTHPSPWMLRLFPVTNQAPSSVLLGTRGE